MGLPERFADVHTTTIAERAVQSGERNRRSKLKIKKPRILLLSSEQGLSVPEEDSNDPDSLGNQFLLGIFPLTWLYLQHSAEAMLLENILSLLQENGAETYITNADNFSAVSSSINPQLTLRAKTADLSVNAYDAVFFRILRINGELQLAASQNPNQRPEDFLLTTLSISTTKYSTGGHAPTLSLLLENSLRAAAKKAITPLLNVKLSSPNNASATRQLTANPILFIEPPKFASTEFSTAPTKQIASIGMQLAQSYGFSSSDNFSPGAILRVIQRGLAAAGSSAELITVTSSVLNPNVSQNSWILKSTVKKLELLDLESPRKVLITSALTMNQTQSSSNGYQQLSAHCEYAQELEDLDGDWVVALEQAAYKTALAFLDGDNTTCQLQ